MIYSRTDVPVEEKVTRPVTRSKQRRQHEDRRASERAMSIDHDDLDGFTHGLKAGYKSGHADGLISGILIAGFSMLALYIMTVVATSGV